MLLYSPPKAATSIPVINISDWTEAGRLKAAAEIHRACRETGFFYVAGHGIPLQLVRNQFDAARAFFDLPIEQKMALHMKNSPASAGYEPVGGQVLDSQDDKGSKGPPDLKESFYSGAELPDTHPWHQRRVRTFGHNQWPDLPGFREQNLAYRKAVCVLGDRILALMALSLDLDEGWFETFYNVPSATLRMIKYPPQPSAASFNQIGAGAHTDWGGITILAQDDVGGLEVRNADNEWITASPVPETFVINLGDLMARWTNGTYNSNMHRVNNNTSRKDRYSIPFFYSPNPDAIIEAIPTCVTPENPRRFVTCTAAEHIGEMFRRSYSVI
ncbi:isopenicillin N synthase family oxygenase [Bradyrhizobium jicamae]|uniref:isopenicillin N synthase family dioxygenase n=1 Tax=Bradyrhizobium jicamae TaxID=280332 RepID=UPI001BA4489B|nr:isopenicillin N synthase family oxygenase [Bradyrhizobium jicamae]MBR0752170.1 isopenicillin N synthase family oxygenase [Bradyrhizobium jicamae]